MPHPLPPVTVDLPAGFAAVSIDDYARSLRTRTEFVDFLLAPVRDRLAALA